MNPQVKLCAAHFRADVTPDTAAAILLLADRHCLDQLKQVHCLYNLRNVVSSKKQHQCMYTGIIHNSTQEVMVKIVAEKAKYLANPDFKGSPFQLVTTSIWALPK